MKIKYYLRYMRWFVREFAYRFWVGKKRSNGPNMTSEEHDKWFGEKNKYDAEAHEACYPRY